MRALGNSTINYCFPLLSSPLPFMMNPSLHCLPVLNWRTKLPVGFLCFSRDTPPMSFVGVSVKSQPWGKHLTIWVPFILLYSSILLEIWFILNFTWKKKKGQIFLIFFSGLDDPWERAMAPHSSTVAQKIPWMEEPGRLQSMGSLRVRHNWRLHFHFSLSCIGEGNGNPLQCSCLENPMDREAW